MPFRFFAHLPHIPFPRIGTVDDGVKQAGEHVLGLGVDGFADGLVNAVQEEAEPDPVFDNDFRLWDHDPFRPGIQLTDPLTADLPFDVTDLSGAGHVLTDVFPDAGPGDAVV